MRVITAHDAIPRFTAAMILELGYGRTITGVDDDFIRLVEKGVSQALSGTGTAAGNSLVDRRFARGHAVSFYR